MNDAATHIKGLPPGWEVRDFYQCKCRHDRDAALLCERNREDGDHGTRYVVWWVNMELGGCFNGFYTDDQIEARAMYNARRSSLQ